jgi:hypothetical protein
VLVLDADVPLDAAAVGTAAEVRPDEPFTVLTPSELAIEPAELRRMAAIYDVLELATALKPFLLRHLVVDRGEPTATYLDPDIEVFAPLDDLHERALEHGLVLTPHRWFPLAQDGREPADTVFTLSGAYNLGYVTVSGAAVPFLDWWGRAVPARLHPLGGRRPVRRPALDRPGGHLLRPPRGPGPRLQRRLLEHRRAPADRGCGRFPGRRRPAAVLSLQRLRPRRPPPAQPLPGRAAPVLLSEEPVLRRLCACYGDQLAAEGWPDCRPLGYGLDRAANGLRLDKTMRRLFRQELLERERGTADDVGKVDELPDPFDPDQADGFVALLRSPFPGGEAPRIPRYLHALYLTRPDLRQFFPDLTGEGGNHFLWWPRRRGATSCSCPTRCCRPTTTSTRSTTPYPTPTEPGVRLVGYLSAELGVGEAGRSMAAALRAAGEPFWPISERQTWNRQRVTDYAEAAEPSSATAT